MTELPPHGPGDDSTAQLEQLLAALHDFAGLLAENPGRSRLLSAILEVATRLPGIDGGGLYWRGEGGDYELVRHRDHSPAFVEAVRRVPAAAPFVEIIRAGKLTILRPDPAATTTPDVDLRAEGIQSAVLLPIHVHGEPLACLNLASRTARPLSPRTLVALETLTRTCTRALERLQTEELLEAERRNLEALTNTLSDYIFVLAADGTILHYNRAVAEDLGYGASLLGRSILEVHPQDTLAESSAAFAEVTSGRRATCLLPIRTADGRRVPVETRVNRGIWNGQPVLIGISRDLREERARAEELARERRLRDTLLESIPALFFALDPSARLVFWNGRLADATERPNEDLHGVDTREFFAPTDHGTLHERIREVFEHGESSVELTILGKNGKRTPCLFTGLRVELDGQPLLVGTGIDISERLRTESALRESQAFLRLLLETIPARVFWKDRRSRYLGSNGAFARDAGLASPDHLVGRTDADLAWRDLAPDYVRDDDAVMRLGQAKLAFEEPIRAPSGEARWIRTSKVPLRDTRGETIGLLGMFEDITEQRELREAIRLRDQYQRALLDNFPALVWLKDGDGRLLAVNQRFAETCGASSPEAVVGRTDFDVWPAPLAQAYVLDDQEVIRSGRPKVVEEPVMVGDRPVWFETYKSPVTIDGRAVGTVGFAADITKRKEREELEYYQHEATELKYRVARSMQSAGASFAERFDRTLATFKDLRGLRPGHNATLVLGASDGEVQHLGDGLWTGSLPQLASSEVVCTRRCPKPGAPHGHYVVPIAQGEERLGTLILDTEPDPPEHPARMSALRGIGETFAQALLNERAAQMLRDATAQAEAASVAKSQFLAMMSHEIRTPMNGILGTAQLLATPGQSDEERREQVATILECGETLLALLNDILDLSKIEAGKLELESRPVDPHLLLLESAQLFDEAARKKGLRLRSEWFGAQARYLADAVRLRQMLANLVNNAVKFTAAGEIHVEGREISRQGSTAELEIAVTDTGIGIPESRRHALFKPFSQVDGSTTRRFGGSGLGLSIVRTLAEEMGGGVGVDSRPGEGSRFWFRIRVGVVSDPAPSPEATPRAPAAALFESAHVCAGRVLIVEDNAVNRMVIERMLKALGMTVRSVDDGQAAVDSIVAGDRPDVVLMDCQMPEMDGFEATARIRRWEVEHGAPRVPIVALTAGAYDDDRRRCLESGMDDFLTKPIHAPTLAGTLARWLAAPPRDVADREDSACTACD